MKKPTKTPKAKKTTKVSKKQQKPVSFIEAIQNILHLDLVQKDSSEANKSLQDAPNDEDNKLYIEATPESPDEPEIIIEVDLDPDTNKIEAEIETPITFKEKPKESPVLEDINKDIIEPEKPNKKENNVKDPIKPIEQKKPVLTYKQRLDAIKARLNRK